MGSILLVAPMIPQDDLNLWRGVRNGVLIAALIWVVILMIACPHLVHAQEASVSVAGAVSAVADGNVMGTGVVFSSRDLDKRSAEASAVLGPSRPNGGGNRAVYFALASAHVFDLWSTKRVQNVGGLESNPLLGQHYGQIVVTKTALTGGVLFASEYLARHGHPKVARWLLYADIGVPLAAGMHNARVR